MPLWQSLEAAIADSDREWATHLRGLPADLSFTPIGREPAFAGRFSILASDQGVRGFLQVCNDISYERRRSIPFREWRRGTTSAEATDPVEVSYALEELRTEQKHIDGFVTRLTEEISGFDWRSAVTPGLRSEAEMFQSRYRSGSGYKQVRSQLLRHLSDSESFYIAGSAKAVARALGYDREWL